MRLLESNTHNLFEQYALQGPIHVQVNGLLIPVVERGANSTKETEVRWKNGDKLSVFVTGHDDDNPDQGKAQVEFTYISNNGDSQMTSHGVLFEGEEDKRPKFEIVHENNPLLVMTQ